MARKVRLPRIVQDRQHLFDLSSGGGDGLLLATPIAWLVVAGTDGFGDGPVCRQVAVEDVDVETGDRRPGARWLPRGVGKSTGCYDVEIPDIDDIDALVRAFDQDAFIQVSSFATVLLTIRFFESQDALGRPVDWAFDASQLRVLPQAGIGANACYDRTTGALEFYSFEGHSGRTVHTALSHDIVVHETAHAILDGIAPDLYGATRTESIALHEAIADLAAIVLTLLNEMVVFSLFNISDGTLDIATALAKVAEEYGSEVQAETGVDALRLVKNRSGLDTGTTDLVDAYAVSEVLSGAVFQVFVNCANGLGMEDLSRAQKLRRGTAARVREILGDDADLLPADFDSVDERRVNAAARDVARLVFRALDYLPPGEASFADFGRAAVASLRAVRSGRTTEEDWLVRELVERGVVGSASELNPGPEVGRVLADVDCAALFEQESAAKRFAAQHRDLLRIPRDCEFDVLPRRTRIRSRGRTPPRDLVFRVCWTESEEHDLGAEFPAQTAVPVGTTLVLDWDTARVLSVLTTETGARAWADRDRTLKAWRDSGILCLAPQRDARRTLVARTTAHGLRVSGSVRVLCT